MIDKLLNWVVGREPLAAATGLAGGVAALLGVLAAFDVYSPTPEQVAAIGALATWVAGYLARRAVTPIAKLSPGEQGSVPLAVLILVALAVLMVIGLAVCTDALFEDEDEANDLGRGRVVLISHERERCYDEWGCEEEGGYYGEDRGYGGGYSGGDYGHNRRDDRNRDRGAFSPGPFDDSPVDAFNGNVICLPGSQCRPDDRNRDEER